MRGSQLLLFSVQSFLSDKIHEIILFDTAKLGDAVAHAYFVKSRKRMRIGTECIATTHSLGKLHNAYHGIVRKIVFGHFECTCVYLDTNAQLARKVEAFKIFLIAHGFN